MKDYTQGSNSKFILKYEKENDEIIIYYANSKIYKNKYTKELEKDILIKMKNQIINTDINKLKEDKWIKGFLSFVVCCILGIASIKIFNTTEIIFLVNFFSYNIIFCIPNMIRKNRIKDYRKNESFIYNIELFNQELKDDMGVYLNLDRKTKKDIKKLIDLKNNQEKEQQDEYQILNEPTINTIDSISINSYNQIKELLEENKEYSKYYEKKKVLKKET